MSVQDDRNVLNGAIRALKVELDGVDIGAVINPDEIERYLNDIDDVYIQVQQFKSRHGVNDWLSWGHNLWSDIERNKAALERNQNRIRRSEDKRLRGFDRGISALSCFFAAVAALSAAVSTYFTYQSLDRAKEELTVNSSNSSPSGSTNSE